MANRRPTTLKIRAVVFPKLEAAIHRVGQEMWRISQMYVPVDSGDLKRSGKLFLIPNGFILRYGMPYSARIEYGMRAHTEHVRKARVRAHRRRTKRRKSPVARAMARYGRLPRGYVVKRFTETSTWVRGHTRKAHSRKVPRQRAQPYMRPARYQVLRRLPRLLRQELGPRIVI